MSKAITDADAWKLYPQHRQVFNKLDLALRLGYNAGPAGVPPDRPGKYIVRPIYNLSGMGAGARFIELDGNNFNSVCPGEFWCETFYGPHITIDYTWQYHKPIAVFAAQGYRTSPEVYRFNCWKRITPPDIVLPDWIDKFFDVPVINIEMIGTKIIEIHLRPGIDFPESSNEIIPVWEDSAKEQHAFMSNRNWHWKENIDNADGHLKTRRLGFYYR